MVLPSGVTHFETFLENTFIFKELLNFFSSFEEEEDDDEGACMLPGGKSKFSVELHSEWVDFRSSVLSLLHTDALEESAFVSFKVM